MKKTLSGLAALLLVTSLCTSCGTKKSDDVENAENAENVENQDKEPQELEIEEEYDIEIEEGDVGGSL